MVIVDGDITLRYRVVRPPTTSELLTEHHRIHGEPHYEAKSPTRLGLHDAWKNARGPRPSR